MQAAPPEIAHRGPTFEHSPKQKGLQDKLRYTVSCSIFLISSLSSTAYCFFLLPSVSLSQSWRSFSIPPPIPATAFLGLSCTFSRSLYLFEGEPFKAAYSSV
jgi:hypothetical protein